MQDFLRHHLLPHHTNNHRPKVLHHHSLLFVILFLLVGSFSLSLIQKSHPAVLGISANIPVQDLLTWTNQKRQEQGLSPLQLNSQLSQAAEQKGQHMFSQNYWAHIAPDGTTPWVFIKNSGYEYLYAGENLARGYTTAPEVVNAWMASPTHRDNLMSPNYKDIGFSVQTGSLTGSDTVLVVQMFGTQYAPKDQEVNAPPAVAVISPQPTTVPTLIPTHAQVLPSQAPVVVGVNSLPSETRVAAIQNKPLVDTKSTKKNIAIFVLLFFIVILVIDAVIIERKKISRVVSHNLDHILFLIIILLAAIIIGKGVIL